MNRKTVSSFSIAAVYIGTVVGAGFATGQEILQFFVNFGAFGLLGLAGAAALFVLFGARILRLGSALDARSHREIIRYAAGERLGGALDYIVTFFLFGSLASMFAGAGALCRELFALPEAMGGAVMAGVTAAVVLCGFSGVVASIRFVAPFLVLSASAVSLASIFHAPPDFAAPLPAAACNPLISSWPLSALLYVSYNIVLSAAVLGPLGASCGRVKTLRRGALLGGLGLGFTAALIFLAIWGDFSALSPLEVPMLAAAGRIGSWARPVYAAVLAAEIFTTAVAALFGFAARMEHAGLPAERLIPAATVLAFLLSRFGFSDIVARLYPVVGYAGFLLLLGLLVRKYPRKAATEKAARRT